MAAMRREATELLRAHRGTYATALFGRHAENTAKLAMLAAVSRDPARPVTEVRDVAWAGRLVEHCIGTVLREADRLVADTPAHARHQEGAGDDPGGRQDQPQRLRAEDAVPLEAGAR